MLEEQLGRIESKIDALNTELRQEVRSAKNELRQELGGRIDGLGHEIISAKNELRRELGARIDDLGREIGSARNELVARIDDLGHQMRLLHEETLANVRDLSLNPDEIRRQFEEADAKLFEKIDRRLDPLEARARKRGKTAD